MKVFDYQSECLWNYDPSKHIIYMLLSKLGNLFAFNQLGAEQKEFVYGVEWQPSCKIVVSILRWE
jgi:hypothetical protein